MSKKPANMEEQQAAAQSALRKVMVSEELFELLGSNVRVEWGEPDEDGFYTPSVYQTLNKPAWGSYEWDCPHCGERISSVTKPPRIEQSRVLVDSGKYLTRLVTLRHSLHRDNDGRGFAHCTVDICVEARRLLAAIERAA